MTGDPIVVAPNDRVVERAAVGIAWKALTKLVIANKSRRSRLVADEVIMGGEKHL